MNKLKSGIIIIMLPFFMSEMCGENHKGSNISSTAICSKLNSDDVLISSIPNFTSRYKLGLVNSYTDAKSIISNKTGTKDPIDTEWMDTSNNDALSGICPGTLSYDTSSNYLVITIKTTQCVNMKFTDTLPTTIYCSEISG